MLTHPTWKGLINERPPNPPQEGRSELQRKLEFVIGGEGFPPKKAAERNAAASTTRKGVQMRSAPKTFPTSSEYMVVLFDLRLPGTANRLDRERTAWQAQSDIEALDENHFVLLVRPGGARSLPR